jgi:hypothetical protein
MDLQNREPSETVVTEDYQEPFVSENFVKSIVIGAMLGGVGFLLYRLLRSPVSHTIPPIIIRSDETTPEPIEIETQNILVENRALSEHLSAKLYRMSRFGLTKYVGVYREGTGTSDLVPYKKDTGLVVEMWLQHRQGNQWHDEPNGPHLIVNGTVADFHLACEQLSPDKPNPGNPNRPRKRSFNRNKNWRISKVRVDNNAPIALDNFKKMTIRFDNHYH